jgi:hypothetical protein
METVQDAYLVLGNTCNTSSVNKPLKNAANMVWASKRVRVIG